MNVFITPISTVMYNYLCNNRENEKVIKIKKIILIFSAFIVSIAFCAKFIINVWIEKYNEAVVVMILLFAAQYVSIMIRCIHINLYKAQKKQNRYFMIMLSIVIVSILLNSLFYNINKSIEAIALATLITNILWFIIGEVEFKNYRLKTKEYIYMIMLLILFIFCGSLKNPIGGFIIYIVSVIVLSVILLQEIFKYCLNQILIYVNKLKGAK